MERIENINLSDSTFHKRIIHRYQAEKSKYFRFPMLVFYKNFKRFLSQCNIIPVNVRLYLKIVLDMDKVLTLKYNKVTEKLLGLDQALVNRTPIICPGKTIFSQSVQPRPLKESAALSVIETVTAFAKPSERKRLQESTIQQILNYLQIYTTDSSTFSPQTTSEFYSDNSVKKNINIKNIGIYPSIQNNNHSLFNNETPVISSPVNFL